MSDPSPSEHLFDETNGLVDGVEGESDGTASGDLESKRDQDRRKYDPRAANIIGGGLARSL